VDTRPDVMAGISTSGPAAACGVNTATVSIRSTMSVLRVVVIIAVIPWRQVFTRYVTTPGEKWRRG
jgi:hypothetical protein